MSQVLPGGRPPAMCHSRSFIELILSLNPVGARSFTWAESLPGFQELEEGASSSSSPPYAHN